MLVHLVARFRLLDFIHFVHKCPHLHFVVGSGEPPLMGRKLPVCDIQTQFCITASSPAFPANNCIPLLFYNRPAERFNGRHSPLAFRRREGNLRRIFSAVNDEYYTKSSVNTKCRAASGGSYWWHWPRIWGATGVPPVLCGKMTIHSVHARRPTNSTARLTERRAAITFGERAGSKLPFRFGLRFIRS
jgi:hypothetical protein